MMTEDFILNATGKKCLKDVHELRLNDMSLTRLDPELFRKMINLLHLDISQNKVEHIPTDLGLPQLRTLDCSENFLESVVFLKQFPKLEKLYIGNNYLTSSDRYIAAVLCPRLEIIDRNKRSSLDKYIDHVKEKLQHEVQQLWEKRFADQRVAGIINDEGSHVLKEVTEIMKQNRSSVNSDKFHDFMVDVVVKEQIKSVQTQISEPPVKKIRMSLRSPTRESPTKVANSPRKTPGQLGNSPLPSVEIAIKKLSTPIGGLISPLRSPSARACSRKNENNLNGSPGSIRKLAEKQKHVSKRCVSLPALPDFTPLHFIRCHFCGSKNCGDNEPADNETIVWMSAFEPDPYNSEKQTGIVATCGGSVVCLIDCKTGLVMKRYKHDAKVFNFYCISWTTVEMNCDGRTWPTNILAAGGEKGIVKLLHPEQLICYHEFSAARGSSSYISCLLFHPENSTWLFCGSQAGTISLWDIGIPSGENYTTKSSHLATFCSPDGSCVSQMVFSKLTNTLLGACNNGLHVWKTNRQPRMSTAMRPSMELILPEPDNLSEDEEDDDICVDGLCMVGEDTVAVKMKNNSTIYLFNLSTTVTKKGQNVTVAPDACLQWCKTERYYLNVGSRDGLLTCGDNHGNIWLYDVSQFLHNNNLTSVENLDPSRILEWPLCELKGKKEKRMIDLKEKEEEILVNHVNVSLGRDYIVGVTDNNMVCIWVKC